MFTIFKAKRAEMISEQDSQNAIQIIKNQFTIQGPRTISEKEKRRIKASNKKKMEAFLEEKELEESEIDTKLAIAGMLCSVALDKYNDDKSLALAYYIEAASEGSVVGAIAVAQLYIKEFKNSIDAQQYFDYACDLYQEEYKISYSEVKKREKKNNLVQVMEHIEKFIQESAMTNEPTL